MLLFRTKSELKTKFGLNKPGVANESVVYKKACSVVFQTSKHEETTLPHEFIFVFSRYFIEVILLKKSCQKRGVRKKDKKGNGHIVGLCIEGRFKPSAYYDL